MENSTLNSKRTTKLGTQKEFERSLNAVPSSTDGQLNSPKAPKSSAQNLNRLEHVRAVTFLKAWLPDSSTPHHGITSLKRKLFWAESTLVNVLRHEHIPAMGERGHPRNKAASNSNPNRPDHTVGNRTRTPPHPKYFHSSPERCEQSLLFNFLVKKQL